MLPAVSELFKTSFDESFKKLLQPAGLVPGALFVLLNLGAIYPALSERKVGAITAFDALTDPWKLVVVLVVILLTGYLVLAFSASTARLATGELWRRSPLWTLLQEREVIARAAVAAKADDAARTQAERDEHRYELSVRYPAPDFVGPTRLGNIFAAVADALWNGYRIDLTATWSQMRSVLKADPAREKALTEIDAAKTDLDTLLNVAIVLALFALEGLILFVALANPSFGTWAASALLVSYGSYRAACVRALAWGDGIQAAYDLFRGELRKALGVREAKTVSDQRAVWEEVSRSLLWDDPIDAIYTEPKPEAIDLVGSDSLRIKDLSSPPTSRFIDESPTSVGRRWWVDYRFLITARRRLAGSNPDTARSYLQVRDPRLPGRLPEPIGPLYPAPPGVSVSAVASVQPNSLAPEPTVWAISGLRLGQAVLLAYRHEWELRVSAQVAGQPLGQGAVLTITAGADEGLRAPREYTVHVKNEAGNAATISVTLRDTRRTDRVSLNGAWGLVGQDALLLPTVAPGANGEYISELMMPLGGATYVLKLRASNG
jgi:hypothetical protein